MQTRLLLLVSLLYSSLLISEQRTIIHEGVEREYIVHIPESLNEDSPILFVIHGFTGSAGQIMEYSGMNTIADREGFLVVYPQGTTDSGGNTFFNVGYEFHKDSTVDDVSFIRDLFTLLSEEYSLKRKQGFATGMSNGGDMSYLLACTSADLFRAVAPVAGSLMSKTKDMCNTQSPVPIFEIHGTGDQITLFDGDMENDGGWGAYCDLPSTISFFADSYNLDNKSTKMITKKAEGSEYDIYFERYWSQRSNEEVWMYKIVEGRHVWPGFKINWWENPIFWYYFGSGNDDINASEEVWRFFKRYL
jgi:polyhydroxybutyrate depolymerase